MQVPTLAPKISAMPAYSEIRPWLAMAMTTPVVAEDDGLARPPQHGVDLGVGDVALAQTAIGPVVVGGDLLSL